MQGWRFCRRTCLKDYLRGSSRFAKRSDGALRCAAVPASLKIGNAFRASSWSAPKPSVNQRSCMQHLMSVPCTGLQTCLAQQNLTVYSLFLHEHQWARIQAVQAHTGINCIAETHPPCSRKLHSCARSSALRSAAENFALMRLRSPAAAARTADTTPRPEAL